VGSHIATPPADCDTNTVSHGSLADSSRLGMQSVFGQDPSLLEVDSDKIVRMWYTALRKEGASPGVQPDSQVMGSCLWFGLPGI
jgi:hypothetical protein